MDSLFNSNFETSSFTANLSGKLRYSGKEAREDDLKSLEGIPIVNRHVYLTPQNIQVST